jgi:hypothetical protein
LIDPARSRHKPLSLLRLEARRVLEQFLEAECPTLPRVERNHLTDELLAESPGLGPLEDLFRDPAVLEVMVVAPGQVVVRKEDAWTPTSVRFRGHEHVRRTLTRYAETGELLAPASGGGFDAWLGNGFRLIAVLPPEAMDVSPTAVYIRSERPTSTALPAAPSAAEPRATSEAARTVRIPPPAERPVPPDPYAPVRQQVTHRIITRLAAAGVHDINRIPTPELRKIVLAYVEEVCESERLWSDASFRDRLTLEILAAMRR